MTQPMTRRVLQRLILPGDKDFEVLPLYLDPDPASLDLDKYEVGSNRTAQTLNSTSMRQSISTGDTIHPDQITGRHTVVITSGDRMSFGTYFNAFPAGYWRRWSVVNEVRLTIELTGAGAAVTVFKSMANGRSQRVDQGVTDDSGRSTFIFDLPLKPFVDGGWYWYDVVAGEADVEVAATWDAEVPADRAEPGSVTVCITTLNRPDFCSALLTQIGEAEDTAALLDELLVMDQGTQRVRDDPGFPAAEKVLGDKLRVIEQGNLGGSGGYARGQLEVVDKGTATYALMMDDDVVCEPEGILRAVTFADLARRPTIVGGHMFSLYARSRMHSYGEIVQPWRFWWTAAPGVFPDWDFSARNLRSTRWLHKRIDVDFNGWFMCLIPRETLETVGLSLPIFIKWDDSEFGLRAAKAGYPTVSFPGAAVWHIPWTDKNDALDWQAYFHQRNRFIAALLHSSYPKGGRMIRESLNHDIAHLVSMRYSVVAMRHQALVDVFAGPGRLHGDLPTKLAEVNALRKRFDDARVESDRDEFPAVRRHRPPRKGRDGTEVPGRVSLLISAGLMPIRQLKKPRDTAQENPEAELPAMDSQWYRIARYDSAVVSMPDGTSAALLKRDRARFAELSKRTVELHERLRREWPRLAEEYRSQLAATTSPEAWAQTFEPWTRPGGSDD